MLRSIVSNHNIEKLEFLPNDIDIYVSRSWCAYAATYLRKYEYYGDLLDRVSNLLDSKNTYDQTNFPIPRFLLISVGDVKKLISLCGGETFCCNFPYNYNEISNKFLEDKLGIIKVNIELLMNDDMIDDTFRLIDELNDEYLKKLSLIYMKYLYNKKTETIIENITVSRNKVLSIINCRLY